MKKKIIIAVAVIAGILAAVASISILAQTPVPIRRAEDNPEFGGTSIGKGCPQNRAEVQDVITTRIALRGKQIRKVMWIL